MCIRDRIRSAGYGKIQIPGRGQLFVKKNRKYKYQQWSKELSMNSFDCDCPVCKENELDTLIRSKKARAIHNAYTLCSEASKAREMVERGEYVHFARDRLKNTVLFALFRHIQERVKKQSFV